MITILCPFSRIIVIGSPLQPITYLATNFWLIIVSHIGFIFVTLKPIRKWYVAPMTFVPVLYPWACLGRLVVTGAHRVYSWKDWLLLFSSSSGPCTCQHYESPQQGRDFHAITRPISLCFMILVCVFSNRPNSRKLPTAMAIPNNVLKCVDPH